MITGKEKQEFKKPKLFKIWNSKIETNKNFSKFKN